MAPPSCGSVPVSATAPRKGPGAGQADACLRAFSWALLAPNPRNLQSRGAGIREPGLVDARPFATRTPQAV